MLVHADRPRRPASRRRGEPHVDAAASRSTPGSLVSWYMGLTPHWTGARPRVRARLLLRTHEWIVDRVLDPDVGLAAAEGDLRPDGALTRALTALVPPEETDRWRHFIDLVVAHLRHALRLPVTRRDEAWVRWLFLIPYSVTHGPEPAPPAVPARGPAPAGAREERR